MNETLKKLKGVTITEAEKKKLVKIPPLPEALGGGKARPVIYRAFKIENAEQLEKILNDTPAYCYINWEGIAADYLVLSFPNPEAHKQRTQKRVERGLEPLSESEAMTEAENQFAKLDRVVREYGALTLERLYSNQFVLCRKVDREVNPK